MDSKIPINIIVRSVLFNVYMLIVTIIFPALFVPLAIKPGRFVTNTAARWYCGLLLLGARVIVGIRMEVRGREYIPEKAAIIACKHQSAWETMVFFALLDGPVFVLKKELLNIPVVGFFFSRMKSIVIDRKAGAKALIQLIDQASRRLGQNRSVIIFPEGTRTNPGETGAYQPGVAALYSKCNVPLVPVAHNAGMYWRKNAFIKRPGTIILQFLEPIAPDVYRRDQVLAILEQKIEPATRALEDEARRTL